MPRGQCANGDRVAAPRRCRHVFGEQQLGGLDALERRRAVGDRHVGQRHVPRGEVEPGNPGAIAIEHERGKRRVALRVEQSRVGQRAGRDDPRDLALDQSLARRRIADLIDDDGTFAAAEQPDEMLLERVPGHAGHRYRRAAGLPACSQRDVEHARGALGIGVEQLVEVAHPIEQQPVGMLALEPEILLHHRRMLVGRRHRAALVVLARVADFTHRLRIIVMPRLELRPGALTTDALRALWCGSQTLHVDPAARAKVDAARRDGVEHRRRARDRLRRQYRVRLARAHADRRRTPRRAAARARAVAFGGHGSAARRCRRASRHRAQGRVACPRLLRRALARDRDARRAAQPRRRAVHSGAGIGRRLGRPGAACAPRQRAHRRRQRPHR